MISTKEILSGMGRFSSEDIALFEQKSVQREIKKDSILLKEGKVCQSVYCIMSGAAYQFYNDDIDENIIGLYTAKDWCLCYSSFITQKPSTSVIKAYSDLLALELTITSIHELIGQSPAFFQLGKILEHPVSRLQYFDSISNASDKYNHLASSRPDILQHFPLRMIASYLKVTPETISRIRKKY